MTLDEDALEAAIKELRELVLDDELHRNRFTISEASIKTYLTAMAERGFQMMPRDPSEVMHRAGMSTRQMQDNLNKAHHVIIDTSDVWRAMFDANAKAKP